VVKAWPHMMRNNPDGGGRIGEVKNVPGLKGPGTSTGVDEIQKVIEEQKKPASLSKRKVGCTC